MTQSANNSRQIELETKPVGRLLVSYAMPSIIAMTATSLYNMADSIFIGQNVGPLGLTGLTVCFPLMNLSAAFGAMVGVGAGSVVAVKLGQKDLKTAEYTLGNVVILNVVISILFSIVCLLSLDPILTFFGASDDSLPYARDYMEVLLYGNVLTHLYLGLNDVTRSSGYPRKAMIATLTAVVSNCILDYLFIVRMGLGIRGAAMATLLAQALAFAVVLSHLFNPRTYLRFHRDCFRWRTKIARSIVSIGSAPFFTNACACLVVLLINNGLKDNGGDMFISAYGIINRVAFVFVMITNGINQGMQPISGYNYGAGLPQRSWRVFHFATMGGTIVMTVAFVAAEFFPHLITRLFAADANLTEITVHGLRIVLCLFPLIGGQIVSSGFLMSLGRAKEAIFLSVTRQMVFLIPCLLILPRFMGADGVWYAMPISDLAAVIVAAIVVFRLRSSVNG